MKKLIALLLLLPALLCAACSKDAEPPAPAKKPIALTLEPANDLLPEKSYLGRWLIDDALMLIPSPSPGRSAALLNLVTGETIPLARVEDFIPATALEKQYINVQSTGVPQPNYLRLVEGTRYTQCLVGNHVRLVDKETGVVHSAVPEGSHERSGVTSTNEIFVADRYNELKVYAFDGTVLHTLQMEEEHGRILSVLPYEGGFAILSGAKIETHSEPMGAVTALHFTFDAYLTLTDEQLRVQSIQRLGTLPMANRVCSMYHLVGSRFLICPDDCNGLLLVDRTGIRHVMLAQDGQLVVVPYEDTPETLDAMLNTRVNLWGVSKDKSCALFFSHLEGREGLYSLNLRTFEITLQMTLAELEALSPDTRWTGYAYWPGGEYLTDGDDNLYRLVDRSELNQVM